MKAIWDADYAIDMAFGMKFIGHKNEFTESLESKQKIEKNRMLQSLPVGCGLISKG